MRVQYMKLGLMAACMLSWRLIASFLDQEFNQNNLPKMVVTFPGTCSCLRVSSRRCGCPPGKFKCSKCLRTPGESDWFDRHFRRAVEPLQGSDVPMSSDALLLWLGLQGKQEMELRNRKHQEPPTKRASCRTCAVVGNSRFLQGSGYGFKINQHDMVLRMSQAPVQGFEMDVGNKTTMRIMYPETASIQQPGTQFLVLPLNSSGLEWFMNTLRTDTFWKPKNPGFQIAQFPDGNKKNKNKILMISLTFLKYIQEIWLKNQAQSPSLGFVAVIYALHTCDQVSLFGFGTDNLKKWSGYWNNTYSSTNTMNNPQAERNVILRLHCEGKIVMYT